MNLYKQLKENTVYYHLQNNIYKLPAEWCTKLVAEICSSLRKKKLNVHILIFPYSLPSGFGLFTTYSPLVANYSMYGTWCTISLCCNFLGRSIMTFSISVFHLLGQDQDDNKLL